MALSAEERLKRLAAMVDGGMDGMFTPGGGDDDKGDSIMQKDPNVELRREFAKMAAGIPPYEGVILQTTNLDHPVQSMSLIKDLTELDTMRALGMSEELYNILKGTSYIDEKGHPHIRTSGFLGHARARQGLLYPGIEGMLFHPREQMLRDTRPGAREKTNPTSWLKRKLGMGGED